jgi:hypothetical protein
MNATPDFGFTPVATFPVAAARSPLPVAPAPHPPVLDALGWLDAAEASAPVGREGETKFTYLPVDPTAPALSVAPSAWLPARRLHRAILARHAAREAQRQRWAEAVSALETLAPHGQGLPGLAVVHVLLTTADAQLVVAQRGPSAYFAGAWTPGFEEQLTGTPDQPETLHACIRRGLAEEFALHLRADQVEVLALAFGIEGVIMNRAVLAHVRLAVQGATVLATPSRPEIVARRLVPLAGLDRTALAQGAATHPTAAARLDLLRP